MYSELSAVDQMANVDTADTGLSVDHCCQGTFRYEDVFLAFTPFAHTGDVGFRNQLCRLRKLISARNTELKYNNKHLSRLR